MRARSLVLPAAVTAAGVGYWFFLRPRHLRWGATDAEAARAFPGDSLIPNAGPAATHAVTIDAPPERVWPWLAQIGQHRGGFYSYAWLENLLGCHMKNADEVHEEWQRIQEGDPVWLHPEAPPMTVAHLEPGRALLLAAVDPPGAPPTPGSVSATWGFYLEPLEGGRTRLLARVRSDPSKGITGRPATILDRALGYGFWEPAHFAMERKMLLQVKALAEGRGHGVCCRSRDAKAAVTSVR
jgi:hypothetical protein